MKFALIAAFCSLRALICSAQCNGAIEYCDLPLSKFTFPGAHNSGSSGLSMPLGLNNLSCVYANQDLTVSAQLSAGIRYFDTDICVEASAPSLLYNCNGLSSNQMLVAYGKTISSSLRSIKAFLLLDRNEVVVFAPADINVPPGVTHSNVQQLLEKEARTIFGAPCVDLNATTVQGTASNGLGCAFLRTFPSSNITLGKIVSSNYRAIFLTVDSPALTSTYSGAYNGITVPQVGALFVNFANSLSNNSNMLTTFQATQTQNTSLHSLLQCSGTACLSMLSQANSQLSTIQPYCFSAMARGSNLVLSPSCSALPLYSVPCPTLGCDCQPVRSLTEVAHRIMLSKGNNVFAMLIDYVENGGILDLVQRMNAANLCNFKGPSFLKSSGASITCGNLSKVIKNSHPGSANNAVSSTGRPMTSPKSLRGGILVVNSSASLPKAVAIPAPQLDTTLEDYQNVTGNASAGVQQLGSSGFEVGSADGQASSNISKSGWTSGASAPCLVATPFLILLNLLIGSMC